MIPQQNYLCRPNILMQALHELQKQFWKSLRCKDLLQTNHEYVSEGGKLTPSDKLNIYRKTSRTAHTNALSQRYFCCEKILGEKFFTQIAKQYFYGNPATNQNLNLYGGFFPQFLNEYVNSHSDLSDYHYLPDLARFEQAYELAYHAKDDELFDFGGLANLDSQSYQNLCFELSEALHILISDYPIYEIWQVNQYEMQEQIVETRLSKAKPSTKAVVRSRLPLVS